MGFIQSPFYPLNGIDGFFHLITGSYKSEKPINITGNIKILLKYDCSNGPFVNATSEPSFYSFTLRSLAGQKIHKEPRIKVFKKIIIFVLSQITLYQEDDDHNSVDFNNEMISITCQLIKKKIKKMNLNMI